MALAVFYVSRSISKIKHKISSTSKVRTKNQLVFVHIKFNRMWTLFIY